MWKIPPQFHVRRNNQNAGVLKIHHEVPLGLHAKVWMTREWNLFVDFGAIPKITHCGNANILEPEVNLKSAILLVLSTLAQGL